jgi:putative NADH-flavin reductase
MHIAVFGATGRTGRPLLEQALERGHEVVAFVHDAEGLPPTVRDDKRVSVIEDYADCFRRDTEPRTVD